jgi:hypothetical protein
MHLPGGYSGSNLQLQNGVVRKRSSYLRGRPDYPARQRFFQVLSAAFPHMPDTRLLDDGILEMAYIPGQEGTQGIDFRRFGQIVRQLHELDIPAPPKDTGIHWLSDLARSNLADDTLSPILSQLVARLPDDAVVHGEITQVIADPKGNLYIIDWDECGLGSKYHDLGFVYYTLTLDGRVDECFAPFLDGYGASGLDTSLIPQVAGLIALAYAGFADREHRLHIGHSLWHI